MGTHESLFQDDFAEHCELAGWLIGGGGTEGGREREVWRERKKEEEGIMNMWGTQEAETDSRARGRVSASGGVSTPSRSTSQVSPRRLLRPNHSDWLVTG